MNIILKKTNPNTSEKKSVRKLRSCCEYRKSTGSKQSPSKLWYRTERENKATRNNRSGSSR
jgi:hypothetical protein